MGRPWFEAGLETEEDKAEKQRSVRKAKQTKSEKISKIKFDLTPIFTVQFTNSKQSISNEVVPSERPIPNEATESPVPTEVENADTLQVTRSLLEEMPTPEIIPPQKEILMPEIRTIIPSSRSHIPEFQLDLRRLNSTPSAAATTVADEIENVDRDRILRRLLSQDRQSLHTEVEFPPRYTPIYYQEQQNYKPKPRRFMWVLEFYGKWRKRRTTDDIQSEIELMV